LPPGRGRQGSRAVTAADGATPRLLAAGTAWLPLLSAGGEVLPFGELDLHAETLRELSAAVDHADRRAEWHAHPGRTVLAEE
jgi:hypothetical protein